MKKFFKKKLGHRGTKKLYTYRLNYFILDDIFYFKSSFKCKFINLIRAPNFGIIRVKARVKVRVSLNNFIQ